MDPNEKTPEQKRFEERKKLEKEKSRFSNFENVPRLPELEKQYNPSSRHDPEK